MATAISVLVILTLSVIAVRVGAVALRLTGLPEHVARLRARRFSMSWLQALQLNGGTACVKVLETSEVQCEF